MVCMCVVCVHVCYVCACTHMSMQWRWRSRKSVVYLHSALCLFPRVQSFYFPQLRLIYHADDNGNMLIGAESLIFWEIHLDCCLDKNDFN